MVLIDSGLEQPSSSCEEEDNKEIWQPESPDIDPPEVPKKQHIVFIKKIGHTIQMTNNRLVYIVID